MSISSEKLCIKIESKSGNGSDKLVLKKDIIPQSWKGDIDKRLIEDLLHANRFFAMANPNIAALVKREAGNTPEYYYWQLRNRWNWHHSFYEDLLEPSIPALIRENHIALSPLQVNNLEQVYETASLVDQATLPITAAIKLHVATWEPQVAKYMSDEDRRLLLTPPRQTFWAEYEEAHIEYAQAVKYHNPDLEKIKADLLQKYHADDQTIFDGRYQKFKKYEDMDKERARKRIAAGQIDGDFRVKHFYSTIERPQLKALRDILIYDNYDEYMILMGLLGVSGYVLRKKVLGYLNDSKILPNEGSLYEFDDTIVLEALSQLKDQRNELMVKDVSPYKQTGLTCGAASLMMGLNYFGLVASNAETEQVIHSRSNSEHIIGNHFSGLAVQGAELGLETVLIHNEQEMFRNNGSMPRGLFNSLMDEYRTYLRKAEALGTKVDNEAPLDSLRVKQLLKDDYLVLIAGKLGSELHAILGVGYNSEGIIIRDPLVGNRQFVNTAEIDRFMDTPVGKWVLAIRQDQKSADKLIQNLPDYKKFAQHYLSKS